MKHNRILAWATVATATVAFYSRAATWYFPGTNMNQAPLRFRAIAAGAGQNLAIESNGVVVAWGYGGSGQSYVPAGVRGARALAGGDGFTLALKSDGTVVGWGNNYYGEISVPAGLNNVVAIAASAQHSLALRSSGEVLAWGAWGDDPLRESSAPSDLTNAVAIATGPHHSIAIRSDGTVETWGDPWLGWYWPPYGLSNVVAIAAGGDYSLALKADGTIEAWGYSIFDETTFPSSLSGVVAIAACYTTCAALKSDGAVVTWGDSHAVPAGLSNVVAIATGGYRYLALKSDGSIVTWGQNGLVLSDVPTNNTPDVALQETVDAASDGDTILVAPGQYAFSRPVVITNAIVLRSTAGPDQTLLTVQFEDYGLSVSNPAAVVDGLTLLAPPDRYGYSGAGISVVGATIQNCHFTNNLINMGTSVFMLGGLLSNSVVTYTFAPPYGCIGCPAVYCAAGGLITDCRVNGACGCGPGSAIGIHLDHSQLRNSLISGVLGYAETADGWAVDAHASTIVGCTITPTLWRSSGARLDNCLMDRCIVAHCSNNGCGLGTGGGGIFETNSLILNSLILSNSVGIVAPGCSGVYGGGVYMQGGALVNCIVAGNSAGQGSGVFIESGSLTNCIIYSNFNYSNPVDNWFNAGPGVFDHCCTTPDPGGVGNITQDPLFLDPTNGSFHLATNSPCLGAGVVQAWMAGAFDLDGNPRIAANGTVDLGAYQRFAPLVLAIQPDGFGGYFLRFRGVPGSDYRLQRAPNLGGPWATSSSQTAPASGLLEFRDIFPPPGQAFYRAVQP